MHLTSVEQVVQRMEERFWARYHANPELQKKLAGKTRVIQLSLTDGQGYWFQIVDGKLAAVQHGHHAQPDANVMVSKHDLLAIFNGEQKAMAAYLTGKVRVRASLGDMLFAKSLLGA